MPGSETPSEYLCCLSKKLMKYPVRSKYGHHFERSAIEKFIQSNSFCPVTGNPLSESDIGPVNKTLQWKIKAWVNKNETEAQENSESSSEGAPQHFHCPLTKTVMQEPVVTKEGVSYERSAILKWLKEQDVCPVTCSPLSPSNLAPNAKLQEEIDDWLLFGGALPPSPSTAAKATCETSLPFSKMPTLNFQSSLYQGLPTSRGSGNPDRFKKRFAKEDLIACLDEAISCSALGRSRNTTSASSG
mmetsp:Transcript_25152/g.41243  ORF Transcript_25152/g.41243 Transcript_25152/m.41243 type:complete len:244 (+) Transcript_25152:329-1060(+)